MSSSVQKDPYGELETTDPVQLELDVALRVAVSVGDYEACVLALENGANPRQKFPSTGNTLLHHAAKAGNADIMELLVAQKLDLNEINDHGDTALYDALWTQHIPAAEVLLRAGAKQNIPHQQYAMNFATSAGRSPLGKALHNFWSPMPAVPDELSGITRESLFAKKEGENFCLADNPELWTHTPLIFEVLAAQGTPLDKSTLMAPGNLDSHSILMHAIHCLHFDEVLASLNAQKTPLTAKELLHSVGTDCDLLEALSKTHQLHYVFDEKFLGGNPPRIVKQLMDALPPEGRAQVNNQTRLQCVLGAEKLEQIQGRA